MAGSSLPVATIKIGEAAYDVVVPHAQTDYVQRLIYTTGLPYESHMLRAMSKLVGPGDLVLDVGAHVGNHTMYLAAVCGCDVVAYEPNLELTDALCQSIRLNRLEHLVKVRRAAVGRTASWGVFAESLPENIGAQRVEVTGDVGDFEVAVLDKEVLEERVALIKIDVEGMELQVLEGAELLIDRDRPHLFVECIDLAAFEMLASWMTTHGYVYGATFNATPTHLFHPEEVEILGDDGALALVKDSYRLQTQLNEARKAHRDATLKYRALSAAHAALKVEREEPPAESAVESRALLNARSAYDRVRLEALQYREERDAQKAQVAELRRQIGEVRRARTDLERRLAVAKRQTIMMRKRFRKLRQRHRALRRRKVVRALHRMDRMRGRSRTLLRRGRRPAPRRVTSAAPVDRVSPEPEPESEVLIRPIRFSSSRVHDREQLDQREVEAAASSANLRGVVGGTEPLRVAAIVDDFTGRSLRFECDLLDVVPEDWQVQLETFRPHLLFVESAWRGKSATWHNTVPGLPAELVGILEWCREHRVPTVFWNKEDPVHFHTFLRVAAEFDHVFTTDVDLVPRYVAALGHARVGFLPFACQPRLQTPVETHERKDALVFAGGYYRRYPERMRDLEALVHGAAEVMPVEIFDRMLGTTHDDYTFPDEYAPFIIGTLAPDEIEVAYKGYRFALNLNSVKDSQSMFARRAFELLASNTLTISNYARGLRIMFGDLVPMSDDREQTRRTLSELVDDPDKADKIRAMGLRKVLSEHTWEDRLRHLLARVTGAPETATRPVVTVVTAVADLDQCHRALESGQRQLGVEVRPHFVTSDPDCHAWFTERGLVVHTPAELQETSLADLVDPEACGVAVLHIEDWHGSHYLLDLALARSYSQADVIGKGAHAEAAPDLSVRPVPGEEYQLTEMLSLRSALLSPHFAGQIAARDLILADAFTAPAGVTQFVIHRFDYCYQGAALAPDATVHLEASLPLDTGTPLGEIYRRLEAHPTDPQLDWPVVNAEAMPTYASGRLSVGVDGPGVRVTSQMDEGETSLVWCKHRLDVAATWPDGIARFAFLKRGPLRIDLALRFFDDQDNLLVSVTRGHDTNHEFVIPSGAARAAVGFTIRGNGWGVVHSVLLDAGPFDPPARLMSNDVLLLADHYPSYADIYRNGFVHARVRGYRDAGLGVDVFRFRVDGTRGHHEYQGVEVTTGSAEALRATLATGQHHTVLVHFLSQAMWNVLRDFQDRLRIVVWVHGAEVQPWHRRTFNYRSEQELALAKVTSDTTIAFWQQLIDTQVPDLHVVFVSQYLSEEVMGDLGRTLEPSRYSVVHNPVDTDTFRYVEKDVSQRHKILSIRPYASRKYANDLSVSAVLELAKEPWFDELEFRFIGDGAMFEEILAPLMGMPNVTIERGYLSHEQMAALYAEYGVVLVPTRWDSQGVSRDEAMASGLVPVTSAVSAVPEFLSEEEGILAPYDDHHALAEGIAKLHHDPAAFLRMSAAAAGRVRRQTAASLVVHREITLIHRDLP